MTNTDAKENYLDKGFKAFVGRYRYELLASLSLVALISGVLFAGVLFSHAGKQSEKEIELRHPTETLGVNDTKLLVDVSGAVKKPGVYEFDKPMRLKDVLAAAGGLSDKADIEWIDRYMNMAEFVKDGQKIYFPVKGSESVTGASDNTSSEQGKINLNHASKSELQTLPGIGEVYAQRIIDNRPYGQVSDLLKVQGIGPKKYEAIKDLVSAP